MSFLFGTTTKPDTKEINNVIELINSNEKVQELTYTTQIFFKKNIIENDYVINVNDFFRNVYGNLRPKTLEIEIKNYNESDTKEINVWYLHTPLPHSQIDYKVMHQFTNHIVFNSSVTMNNSSPYMVFYQEDDTGVLDIDVSQLTNVNIVPYKSLNISLGHLLFQLQRKTTKDITLELTFKLKYTFKQY